MQDQSVESFVERVLSGNNRQLAALAAQGLVPLPPERLIPLQVKLAAFADEEVAAYAARSLREVDPRLAAPVLAGGSDDEILSYFARNSEHPVLLETIVRLKEVPGSILVELAARVPAELQEVVILRQDAILETPEILDALESNPELKSNVRRRVNEYRQHLLPTESPEPEPEGADGEEEWDATPEEVAEAIEAAKLEAAEGEVDEQTGLTEGQIRTLSVPVRLQLCRGSGKTLRDILIRDSNPLVATTTFKSNSFSDSDIERIARMRTIAEDVLEAIGRESRWVRKYAIAVALVKNPRTPIPIAVGLVPRLSVRELRILRKDRNISDAVRTRAQRLFVQKVK